VGEDLNTDLLDRLAAENGGTQQYVSEKEDIEVKVSSFYDKVSTPVLSGVSVEAKGIELKDIYPRQPPDVFAGGQVLLFARYRGEGRQTVVVRGEARGRQQAFECEADFGGSDRNDFLPSIWAHRKVAFLLEEIRLHGHNKELEDEIVSLGKRYGIMTPYTSFLVVEDNKPETRDRVVMMRQSFEGAKAGRAAVSFSRNLAGEMMADAAAPAGAPVMLGFGMGGGGNDGTAYVPVQRDARERMRKVADKTFYLDAEGCYVDSAFEECLRAGIVDVAFLSDDYFKFLAAHEGIGRYLAAKLKMILVVDGKAYRIGN
jgi:Ca-activated chloride channel homolog